MKLSRRTLAYELPQDIDILEAYINKNTGYRRADERRMRRLLRKLQ